LSQNFEPNTLVDTHHYLLETKQPRFDFQNPPIDPIELAHILAKNMIYYNGIGLSANQIGLPYRAFVLTGEPIMCCFNPNIVDESSEKIYLEETSLTSPGFIVKIKRPISIRVRYAEPNGDIVTKKLIGMTSRMFQQQVDILDGIRFASKATSYHKEKALKKMKKIAIS